MSSFPHNIPQNWFVPELERTLAGKTEQQQYDWLGRLHNIWTENARAFAYAAAKSGAMPARFDYGPHGWISAADYHVILGIIDQHQSQLERARVPA